VCSSQWTLERTIGNLGEEIKQPSNPFANLSQRGIRRARVNALKALIPNLTPDKKDASGLPRGARDLGDGFVLMRAREEVPCPLRDCEADALRDFLPGARMGDEICVRRWAKLRLPTGQNCYSAWKETQKPIEKRRTARNVKVCSISLHAFLPYLKHIQILLDDQMRLGEVQFFILWIHEGRETPLALVSLYSTPEPRLLKASHNTLWSCEHQGDLALQFIDAKIIQSVVAMIPHMPAIEVQQLGEHFFLVEKPGLDVAVIGGMDETEHGHNNRTID
jgi:hypothetical protein